jgi:predicted dehydrogenase
MTARKRTNTPRKIRYGVIGLGHIAQIAMLPAFRNARRNSTLAALISGDDTKLDSLGRKYGVDQVLCYDQFEEVLTNGTIDALYVALPNDMHHAVVVRAARAGIHVLCEKPLGMNERECREMIEVASENDVRLMTAYRLHYEPATLHAIELVRKGRIGAPRMFSSTFSMQVTDRDNIRLAAARGGGPLFDLGVYCINAARGLFRSEPIEVVAAHAASDDPRFREVPEMTFAVMRFPDECLATFGCSFGAGDTSSYQIVGTKGDVRVEPAYEHAEGLAYQLTIKGKKARRRFKRTDQFGAELLGFSDAVLNGTDPEPSGWEGLADLRVIDAIQRSALEGRAIQLAPFDRGQRPNLRQEKRLPPVRKPKEINAEAPHA